MSENLVTTIIIDRIDKLDDKIDENISNLRDYITASKLDIQKVQTDLTNHLDNKKSADESSKRKMYFVSVISGVIFTAYAAIKELELF